MRRLFATLLALVMVLSLAVSPAWADDNDLISDVEMSDEGMTLDAPADEGGNDEGSGTTPAAIKILYTNDVHTHINKSLSYASVAAMKKDLTDAGNAVLLVDAGDHIQGTAFGGMDKGKTILQLMIDAGYNVATLGNHEFDYGMERALAVVDSADKAGLPYVSCNFYHEKDGVAGGPVLPAFRTVDAAGKQIAFIGITTPESFTKSTPKYFQDNNGNYIYGIAGGTDGAALYAAVQQAIDNAKAAKADYVIALGHLGVDPSSAPWRSTDVIANTTGLDAFIDGHSHSTVEMQEVKDKAGNTVILTQTGSYFGAVGEMTITADGITTKLITEYANTDEAVKNTQDAWVASVNGQLGTKIAECGFEFTDKDAAGKRAVRNQETNLGDLNADAFYWFINQNNNCDAAIMNGGGIRANAPAGDWSYSTCKTINTFGNVLCAMKVTGQQILDALEWGAKDLDKNLTKENGGFLHVAGMKYQVDTTIASTVQKNDKNVWIGGPTGEYRVHSVEVFNKATGKYEPLDLTKTYTLGGTNYTLRDLGDGFAMFGGATLVLDYISEDYLAMAEYVKSFKDTDGNGYSNIATANSPIAYAGYAMNYENTSGSGRIRMAVSPATEDAVNEVADLIKAIGTVTKNSEAAIKAAENAYNALTADQQELLDPQILAALTEARAYYDANFAHNNNNDDHAVRRQPSATNSTKTGAGSTTTKDGKTVESGKTFDAGIAVYVGLSLLSVTGGALVIGKKKEF